MNHVDDPLPLVKVVGISAAGKSTLVESLRRKGYDARPVSQEHSQIPDLWRRIRPPVFLIYLDVKFDVQQERRPDVSWSTQWLQTETERLAHARQNADLKLDTSQLTIEEVSERVTSALEKSGIRAAEKPLPPLPRTGGVSGKLAPFRGLGQEL